MTHPVAPPGYAQAPPSGPGPGHQPMNLEAEVCPDVAAFAASRGITRPRDLRYLQRMYDRAMAQADDAFDFGGYVLARTRGRRGSVPVDSRVGERVARRIA